MYAVMPSPGAARTSDGDPEENVPATLSETAEAIQEIVRRSALDIGCPSAQKKGGSTSLATILIER